MKILLGLILLIPLYANAQEICTPTDKLLLPATQQLLDKSEMVNIIKETSGIMLGEKHDELADHEWQLEMLKQIYSIKKDKTVLVIEMLPTNVQSVLDAWILDAIDTEKMLKDTDWKTYWNDTFPLYQPIFEFAKEKQIRIIAGNTTTKFKNRIRDVGWDALTKEEYNYVPIPIVPTFEYFQYLLSVLQNSHHNGGKQPTREAALKFVSNQQLWDTILAKSISKQVSIGSYPVLLVGFGHLQYGWGVPFQLKNNFNVTDVKSFMLWHNDQYPCAALTTDMVDGVFGW